MGGNGANHELTKLLEASSGLLLVRGLWSVKYQIRGLADRTRGHENLREWSRDITASLFFRVIKPEKYYISGGRTSTTYDFQNYSIFACYFPLKPLQLEIERSERAVNQRWKPGGGRSSICTFAWSLAVSCWCQFRFEIYAFHFSQTISTAV